MEVLSPSKKHTTALEMVSEDEEEEVTVESEHEEGEISSEDEVEVDNGEAVSCPVFQSSNYHNSLTSYPPHFSSFQERRTCKKPSSVSVASEVVIYDDSGRTAIFTSPKKPRVSSYPRRGEGSRQHARGPPRRKNKEAERGRRHHMSTQPALEKWPKASRRSASESKGSGMPEEGHLHPYKAKKIRGGHRKNHTRQSSPESTSGSSCASSPCSSSSSSSLISCSLSEEENDTASVSPHKRRGKENRCGPASKGHDRSPPREYGCERPPPKVSSKLPIHHSKHGSSQHRPPSSQPRETRWQSSYHHNIRRSSKERELGKASHHQHQHHCSHQKPPKAKASERKGKDVNKSEKSGKEAECVVSTAKGQNWLPRGSLGEMLLSRPKAASAQPTPSLQDIPRPPGEDPKTSVKVREEEEDMVKEMVASKPPPVSEVGGSSTLDQEDDEELQLRLIAIQSSLRLLTDMQKEGQQQEETGEVSFASSTPTKKVLKKAEGSQESLKNLLLPLERSMGIRKGTANPGSYTPPSVAGQEALEIDCTLSGDVMSVQNADDIISISSSSASEICVENLATNKSYLEASVEERDGGGGKVTEEIKRKLKECSDEDQNPVDMEICDSSGEDEIEPSVVVQDSPLSPDPSQDMGQGEGEPATKDEGVARVSETRGGGGGGGGGSGGGGSGGNFQIPVEWAYMVPPPPPPDQPANDLQNINSWCFDQNMYLQSMQVAPQEEYQQQEQEEQHQQEQQEQTDTRSSEWPTPPQPHTAPWPAPFMEAYDSAPPCDSNTSLCVPMGFPPELPQHLEASASGHGKDLKDVPAEQYQAFMSAVLQQQSPVPKGRAAAAFTECPQRNLIMVPLSGNHHPKRAAAATATKVVSKKAKAKRLRNKKRLLKMMQKTRNSQQITDGSSEVGLSASASVEEEDEDLLRAQLLIDMSRKKEQRMLESQSLAAASTTSAALPVPLPAAPSPAPFLAPTNRAAPVSKEGCEDRASPQTLLHPSEVLPPAPRSLRMLKGSGIRPRSGESSPTHTFRGDMRPGLSDIGGWGLDPKGSKFNYHSMQHDFLHSNSINDIPKVKFPAIERVIINLKSDSEDSDSESEAGKASCHDPSRKEGEVEGLASEPMSQSIDFLLKSMRNANMGTTKDCEPASPKPGPSTPSAPVAPSAPAIKSRDIVDSTPQAVRHLSRHQQEEYRWLKEQLRKKEMLQRKKLLQRPLRAKLPQPQPPPPVLLQSPLSLDDTHITGQGSATSPSLTEDSNLSLSISKEASGEVGNEGTSSSARAVTWKDMGLLQIQVSNEAALHMSNESEDSSCREMKAHHTRVEGDSSVDVSATEDEDEETLRMMALLTQRKKKAENSTSEAHQRRVFIEKNNVENTLNPEAKESEDVSTDSKSEEHSDEGMKGEWMVLDEVREEGTEVGEEELCVRFYLSGNETEECGEGAETSDGTESVSRSPMRGTCEENPDGRQQEELRTVEEGSTSKNSKANNSEDGAETKSIISDQSKVVLNGAAFDNGSFTQADVGTEQHEPPSKPNARQKTESICDGEKIEEVIRRIENKTRGVLDKAGNEASPLEVNRSSVSSQGNARQSLENTSPVCMPKKQLGAGLSVGSERKTKVSERAVELKQAKTSHPNHSEEADSLSLVRSSTTASTTVTSLGTKGKGLAGSQSRPVMTLTAGKQGKVTAQRTVTNSGASQVQVRKVKVVKPTVGDLQEAAGKETAAAAIPTLATTNAGVVIAAITAVTAGDVTASQETEKSAKIQLQLKRLEKEYREKKNEINKMIAQLGPLLQEVNEEQQQRQALKKSLLEMRVKLKEMEAQLENKSNGVQTKMELIRRLQQQLGTERQVLGRLELQGERLGRQVHGSSYSLPKALPSSPHSKTKDAHLKKTLASSINALRQQVRDLTNKRKNRIRTGTTNNTTAGVEGKVVRMFNLDPEKETVMGTEKVLPQQPTVNCAPGSNSQLVSRTVSQGKAQGKEGTGPGQGRPLPVKRKSVAIGPGTAKVARVQVPVEGSAMLERRGTGVQSGTSRPKADNIEEGDRLDEMKALCPHDLLGRCNDTSCQYQHLPIAWPLHQAPQTTPCNQSQPATRRSKQGAEPHVSTVTQGWVGRSDGKAGTKVKMVPGGVTGGGVAGRAVSKRLNSEVVKSQPQEPHAPEMQEQQTETSPLGPQEETAGTVSLTETPTTQQQTETFITTVPEQPTTQQLTLATAKSDRHASQKQTEIHMLTEPDAPTTQQQTDTITTTEPEVEITQQQTGTHTTTEPDTPITHQQIETLATTELEETDRQELQSETYTENLTESFITDTPETKKVIETEPTQTDPRELQSNVPTTEPQETEMEEMQTEASVKEPQTAKPANIELQNEEVLETKIQPAIAEKDEIVSTEPQTETSAMQPETQTSAREPVIQTGMPEPHTTAENTQTQKVIDDTKSDPETVEEDRLSDTTTTRTKDEELLSSGLESFTSTSSTGCQPSRRCSLKASTRLAKRRVSSRRSIERKPQDTAPSQERQNVVEKANDHQEEARVTRRSLKDQVKASNGTSSSNSSAKPSTGKGRKRRSGGEKSTAKTPSSKRRYPTRL